MAGITYVEVCALQKKLQPIAQKLYDVNDDFKKYVACYWLRQKCASEVRLIAMRWSNRLSIENINTMFNNQGYWNVGNRHLCFPLDEMNIYLFYMQKATIAMKLFALHIHKSPQKYLIDQLIEIESPIIEYNRKYYTEYPSDGADFVTCKYADYRKMSIQEYLRYIELIREPEHIGHYSFVAKQDTTAKGICDEFYYKLEDFCKWNKIKNGDVKYPKGAVFFGCIMK